MSTRQNGMKGSLAPSSPPPNASSLTAGSKGHSVQPKPLGLMQCGVGTLKHGLEESPVHWISGYADTTRRFIALIATGGKQRAESRIKFLRLFLRQAFRLHIPEQDKKFIVTDPADIVRTPEYPPQDSRDIVQHNVPELPPPRIVDPFKVIHINNKHRMGLAHVAFQKTQIYQMPNRHPIVASREAIPVRRFFLNQHGLLAFRHTHCPLYAVGRILSTSTLIAATPTGCRNRAPTPYS